MIITLNEGGGEMEERRPRTPNNDIRLATVNELLATAGEVLDQAVAESALLSAASRLQVPEFSQQEVLVGPIIGRGGFSVVRDIDRIKVKEVNSDVPDETVAPSKGLGGIFGLCFGGGREERPGLTAKTVDTHYTGADG
eukprot:CAMPEP_0176147228 /NCGR_PEP_ID=MMETSP0120_2-20121206/75052_1 /TAXON_ID=160619 /ORGANISM="Kryptoperidinium foliaceum, Strain CCMP 1326" /LENGTH=138 /DNA_ID=CAMNT_0017483837 /DNA_START=58 /DNA_END=470 /DNA_ORIENTATION=-